MMELDAYRAFTRRLQANLEADPRALGLVAVGSTAEITRTPDGWSDHDFFVVVAPGAQEDFRRDLVWLPDHAQIVLRIRETEHGLKLLYAGGHMIEVAVADPAEMTTMRLGEYRVVFERAAEPLALYSVQNEQAPPGTYDAARDAGMVIALLYVGAGRYARGERLSAHAFITYHALQHLLPLLAHALGGADHPARDVLDPFRRFEQAFPPVGAEIERALSLPLPDAATALLDLLERVAGPALPNFPAEAARTLRAYLRRAAAG
jgi:lincosamide nucleotidyltransferase B/F